MNYNKEIKKELKKNWTKVYIWEDKPNEFYEKYSHPYDTKLVILEGEMLLTIENKRYELIGKKK